MIQVSIWFAVAGGDGVLNYLIDIPTEDSSARSYFEAAPMASAIRRALTEFENEYRTYRITEIKIRTTPDKILKP